MIKQAIKTLMMGGAMMALPLMFTSCEDILGHWEKPTPAEPSVEEMLTNLGSALEEGALVTITYTVDGVTYTSTFKKVGDEYVEQSTTSAARALTRAGETGIQAQLQYMPSTAVFNVQVVKDNKVVLSAEINRNNCTYAQTFSSDGAELKGGNVDGRKASLTNANDQTINIHKGDDDLGSIGCKAGETVSDYLGKQSMNGHMVIQTDDAGGVIYSNGGVTGQLYNNAGCSDPVRPGQIISDDFYLKLILTPYQYKAASWDGTNKKVVYYPAIPDEFTLVSPSKGNVTWGEGTYVVKSNVTIGGSIYLYGNVNLILCDGKTLTVNGGIEGWGKSLTIYGQSQGDTAGKLLVTSRVEDLAYFSHLTIHGGNITVENNNLGISFSPLTVYGGIVSITSNSYAIYTGPDKNVKVYGGEVNAISLYDIGINLGDGDGTLTVYGGKVTAEGKAGKPAIQGKFTAGEGIDNVCFGGKDPGDEEMAPIVGNTTTFNYFCAEVEPQ